MTGWFPAKFVEILDERSKEVWRQPVLSFLGLFLCWPAFIELWTFSIFVMFFNVTVSSNFSSSMMINLYYSKWLLLLCVSSVLISRRWLCDRGSDRPGQRHTVPCPESHISAWSQETLHTGRALSPLVIHWRGNTIPNSDMSQTLIALNASSCVTILSLLVFLSGSQ